MFSCSKLGALCVGFYCMYMYVCKIIFLLVILVIFSDRCAQEEPLEKRGEEEEEREGSNPCYFLCQMCPGGASGEEG